VNLRQSRLLDELVISHLIMYLLIMTNIEAIDILIQRLNETPLLSKAEVVKRYDTFQNQVIKRMMTDRVTYGVASSAPEHLNQTESKFRQTIKDTNNDLL